MVAYNVAYNEGSVIRQELQVLRLPIKAGWGNAGLVDHGHFAFLADCGRRENMATTPSKDLQTFENPKPQRDYEIKLQCPEFTCLCPMTGQPDFATIRIAYVPDQLCVELKSLKLYLWSFRDQGAFHEAVTNQILDDLVALLKPRQMQVEAEFQVRGGIHTTVGAKYHEA